VFSSSFKYFPVLVSAIIEGSLLGDSFSQADDKKETLIKVVKIKKTPIILFKIFT